MKKSERISMDDSGNKKTSRFTKAWRRILATFLVGAMTASTVYVSDFSAAFAVGEFDTNVPEFTAAPVDTENPKVYTGSDRIADTLEKVYYNDISRVFQKKDIVRMTALGFINNFGERAFRPPDHITGFEALGQVIGLIGGEAAVVRKVQDEAGTTTPPERMKLLLNRAYYDDAAARGIVLPNEMLGLEKPITRERAALFLARAVGIPKEFAQTDVYTFQDWAQVEPSARPLIEALVGRGIIPLKTDGTFAPKQNLGRAEFAGWLSSAFDKNLPITPYQIGYGLIISKETVNKKEGADNVTEYILTLKSPTGETVQIRTRRDNAGRNNDFVVHRDGITTTSRFLERGDEVEYIYSGDEVLYVGSLPNGQVLLSMVTEKDKYFYTHYGKIIDIKTAAESRDGKTLVKEIYRVLDITGDAFDIVVREDGATGLRSDVFTFKNGTVGGVKLLRVGDSVEYITNDKQEIGYIKVGEPSKKDLAGTINKIEPATENAPAYVSIYDYDEKIWRFPLAPYASAAINGRAASIRDFVYGLEVKALVVDDTIISLAGESYRSEPGYIPPFGKMRMGKVVRKGKTWMTIKKSNGVNETVDVPHSTQMVRDGAVSSMTALKIGEEVKVYFSDIYTDKPDRIEIQPFEKRFARIYKGKLKNFVPQSGELHLVGSDGVSKPEYSSNNKWAQTESYSKDLAVSEDCEIYFNNTKLSPAALERFYKGYDVYAVTEEVFGKETAVKISVRSGAEMLFSSHLRTYDSTLRELEILTKENFTITDATIFVRDGHIVPVSSLSSRDTVHIAAETVDGTNDKNAMFVSVTSKRDYPLDFIRIGAVETVSTSTVTLRNHTYLVNNKLEKVNPNTSGHYKLMTGTLIKDISDPKKIKEIAPNKFFHNKYGRSENYEKGKGGLDYKRYYTFMVVNPANNTILAMNMRKGGLLEKNLFDYKLKKEEDIQQELAKTFKDAVITRGVVTGRDEVWDRFEITEAHDYTAYTGVWTPTETNIYVKHADAIVVKNNRIITTDEIKVGDYVYVFRIGTDSLVIYVD
ncbi:MAG: S-layer homology domain-containing protein [Bacillota bacterium]|nr:S-layer homology domain-containing protein [Bacillota bacterium]